MSKRNAQVIREAEMNRKLMMRREKDAKRTRQITYVFGTGLGVALVALIVGLILQFVVEPQQAIASVNGDTITVGEFQRRNKYDTLQLQNQLQQYQQIQQQFGAQQVFTQQIQQLQQLLNDPINLGLQTQDQMVEEKLVRQQAQKLGVTVSADEVQREVERQLGYQRETPTPAPTPTTAPSATPDPAITTTQNLTPTVPAPTPTLVSKEEFDRRYRQTIDIVGRTGVSESEYRTIVEARLLRDKLQTKIGEDVPKTEEQVHARHILFKIPPANAAATASDSITQTFGYTPTVPITGVQDLLKPAVTTTLTSTNGVSVTGPIAPTAIPTPQPMITYANGMTTTNPFEPIVYQQALSVRDRLLKGEDWDKLAKLYSSDTSNKDKGGDLGFAGKGQYVKEFEDAIFSLPINEISQPVKTQFGFHLIQVLEKDPNHPISESELSTRQQKAFTDWLTKQKADANIKKESVVGKLPPTAIPAAGQQQSAPVQPSDAGQQPDLGLPPGSGQQPAPASGQ